MNRFIALLLASSLLIACESQPAESEAEGASQAEKAPDEAQQPDQVKEQIEKGVEDMKSDTGPKWKVEFSGDMSGEVEGGIMSVIEMNSNRTIAGGAMTEDGRSKAQQSFNVAIHDLPKEGPKPMMVNLTLPDGTRCTNPTGKDSTVEIENAQKKNFEAEITGKLTCGEDKQVSYTAMLDESP